MESFVGCIKVVVISGASLFALLLILLALPQSRLRSVVFEAFFWMFSVAAVALVVSPIDIIPDIAIGVGQIDDLLYIVGGVGSALLAFRQRRERQRLGSEGARPVIDVTHEKQ